MQIRRTRLAGAVLRDRFPRAVARVAAASLALAAFAAFADGTHRHGPYGDYDVIHEFDGTAATGGELPYGALAYGNDGKVYGDTTQFVDGGTTVAIGGMFRIGDDHSVALLQTTGPRPVTVLAAHEGGLFLTYHRELPHNLGDGWSYIVHQAPSGARQTLHSFLWGDPAGYYLQPVLSEGPDGSLYGATQYGTDFGNGTIFRMAPDGSVTPLAYLTPDKESPFAMLLGAPAADGNLYVPGWRGIYRITPTGVVTVAGTLDDATTGSAPPGPLVSGPDGALYGAANGFGPGGNGTVFRFDPSTGAVSVLHAFVYPGEGQPSSALTLAADGYFYGQLQQGSSGGYAGGIFRIRPDGSDYAFVAAFDKPSDGYVSGGPLLALRDGRLLGTRTYGGALALGSIFSLTPTPAAGAK